MKKFLKEITPAIILSFVASFMLYIYEPIITYSSNIDDFWFDFKLLLPNILLYCTILFAALLIIYIILYCFICLLLKKNNIYKIIMIISFIVFLYVYIQGNYLSGHLPILDGTTIVWESYIKDNIISICVVVFIIIAEIIIIKKFKLDKTVKINKYITMAVFAMLFVSLITTLLTPGIYKEKIVATSTNRNLNNASSDKNFFIFLVDAVDSAEFAKVLNESGKYESTFDDFTYFPDTVSAYTFTRDAIPFMFSGVWNENEREFSEYANDAFDNSVFLKELKDEGYEMNFYEYQIHWSNRNAQIFSNIDIYNDKINTTSLFKQLTKYSLFKYLPYSLKKYSSIESADFDKCKIDEEGNYFSWGNAGAYQNLLENDLNIIDDKYFQFYHIEGAHVPFDYDEDVNKIPEEEGTYDKKLLASLKIIDTFINRLKENNVYDNSVIIVMADHGYWTETNGRQNPILYIKGIDEHHEMITSDLPISYEDLIGAYQDLLQEKKSSELFSTIDLNRVRRFLYNGFEGEDSMPEYEQRGKAWDRSATFETGRVFNR